MIKTILSLLISIFLLNSCSSLKPSHSSAKYHIEEPYPYPWVGMTSGTWAIYDIKAPPSVAVDIHNEAYLNFKELLGNRLIDQSELSNLLIDRTEELNILDSLQLNEIAENSEIDYIILISAKEGEEIHYTEKNHSYNRSDKDSKTHKKIVNKEGYVNIRIYDLQKAELLFDRSCKAELNIEDKQAIDFSPSRQKMLKKAYKKLFKSLKANTILNIN